MLKEQKGITLVALIITIIVMLILAGVSISLVVGDNGVLTQAQDVEPKQVQATLKEAVALANADIMSTYYGDTSTGKTNSIMDLETPSGASTPSILSKIQDNYSYNTKNPIRIDTEDPDYDALTQTAGDTSTYVLIISGLEAEFEKVTINVKCEKVLEDADGDPTGILYNISAQ